MQNQSICISMRVIISNNIKRFFSMNNTKKIIPCISCKNYNIDNQTCKRFDGYSDYNEITGDQTYSLALTIRNDDNKCGLEKMIGYEPILQDLLNEHNKIKSECKYHETSSLIIGMAGSCLSAFGLSIPGNLFFISVGMGFLACSFHEHYTFKKLKKTQDKLQRRINVCQNL